MAGGGDAVGGEDLAAFVADAGGGFGAADVDAEDVHVVGVSRIRALLPNHQDTKGTKTHDEMEVE